MFRDDWLLRVIRDVVDALARILKKKEEGKYEEALEDVRDALGKLLGPNAKLVGILDAATLAHMCPNAETVRALAELRREEADVLERQGDEAGSKKAARHALALYDIALDRAEGKMDDDPGVDAALDWLEARV